MRRHPWLFPLAFVLAVAAHFPSLGAGFYADDYLHQIVLSGEVEGVRTEPFSLYDFGAVADWSEVDGGVGAFPWWTSPDWSARFFRPLTSATLWLDHALFGDAAVGYHATSLAWYAVLLALVWSLYRGLGLSRPLALGAFVLYATTNGALVPVGWPANRNSLVETTLLVASVVACLCIRPDRRGLPLVAALACATLACLAKESGVVAFLLLALLLARAGDSDRDPGFRRWARRCATLCVLVPVAWLATLAVAGFGTTSLFYATPWHEPGAYLGNLGLLASAGVLRLFLLLPLDLIGWRPDLALPVALAAAAVASPVVLLVWRRRAELPHFELFATWALLGLAVQGAPPISDRLILTATVGSAPLLAGLVAATWTGARRRERWAARGIVLVSGLLAAPFVPLQSYVFARTARETRAAVLAADVGAPELGHREVVVLQAGSSMVPFVIASTWGVERPDDRDLQFWLLQAGRRGLDWHREDEHTFTLRSHDLPFLDLMFERVYRTRGDRVVEGQRWHTALFDVEAIEVDEAGLRAMRVRFSRSPDDPRIRFLVDVEGRLTAVEPPAVGETRAVEQAVSTTPFMP